MTDATADEMVTLRRADFEAMKKFYGDELAKRREVIMATLMTGSWSFGDVSVARNLADAIMEAAK